MNIYNIKNNNNGVFNSSSICMSNNNMSYDVWFEMVPVGEYNLNVLYKYGYGYFDENINRVSVVSSNYSVMSELSD